ncbi:MAG: hypothetical protein H7Y59_00635 [Anaerolineales bacterium]|nr:hypothetical protein [Anaerolineales bacterium]
MRKRILLLFTTLLIATSCNGQEKISTPADFAFVFEHASCGTIFMDILDTTQNVLIQKTPEGEIANTIPLNLLDEQMDEIYQKLIEIDFFSYPEIYIVPDEQIRGYQAPSGIQKLTVTANSQIHSVVWTDEIFTEPPYMDEINLRDLADLILEVIWSNPDYQSLIGCA